jgi:HEPN domain-containing protein
MSAKYLFENNPSHYDSAGYLSQLGVELLFKAWHLNKRGTFPKTHNLETLYNGIHEAIPSFELSHKQMSTLTYLDSFYDLRYPKAKNPIEVGDEDWDRILSLLNIVCKRMPKRLFREFNAHPKNRKGGRTLMEKTKKAT